MARSQLSSPYVLSLDLRVLDHLGINLYSNAAAVLSEAVANAWDADAQTVSVDLKADRIEISDDGIGMDLEHINRRFLNVGYDKRGNEGETSGRRRRFMGRKGIGKLALFSIADVIEVHTKMKGASGRAFRMQANAIRAAIKGTGTYHPEPIPFVGRNTGTKIVLKKLKKRRTAHSVSALRKRIARRFSVIGYKSRGDKFSVLVDGEEVGPQHREDLRAVEFLWEFGDKEIVEARSCLRLRHRELIPDAVDDRRPDWIVRGWLGAASEPKSLRHDEAGAMNGIVVLARGRLIQENILDKLSFSRILGSYITGQVEADFLDVPGAEDIATSDRQRLMEDDERYEALRDFLRRTLVNLGDQWTRLRNEARGEDAISEQPALRQWLDTLPNGQRSAAKRLLGLIRGADLEQDDDRIVLYRSGVAAFERLRLRETANLLGEEGTLTAAKLLPLLSDMAMYEGALYLDIVRSRLEVIRRFENIVDAREKEKVLQKHMFENLWLLDPGWERAGESPRIEQKLKTEFREFAANLTDKQNKGRVDIRYKTNAGEHIIVELKRAGRKLTLPELQEQGQKYWSALRSCLAAAGEENPNVSIVFVVGQSLREEDDPQLGRKHVSETLRPLNARVMHYETLIRNAQDAYGEFLRRAQKIDRLESLVARMAS